MSACRIHWCSRLESKVGAVFRCSRDIPVLYLTAELYLTIGNWGEPQMVRALPEGWEMVELLRNPSARRAYEAHKAYRREYPVERMFRSWKLHRAGTMTH